jgi:non-canonical poly(A) RNA polymerase PAPD5/7
VSDYLAEYSVLKYLVLPLKQLLYYSKMNDPYQGGLSSYGLILMIVTFLQWKIYSKEEIAMQKGHLGNLLVDF